MAVGKVSDANFEAEVLKATGPVVVDFWAEWCGPCRMIAPALEEISSSMGGKVKIVKLNVDESPRPALEIRHHVDSDADDLQERRAGLAPGRRRAEAETGAVDHRDGLTSLHRIPRTAAQRRPACLQPARFALYALPLRDEGTAVNSAACRSPPAPRRRDTASR